jgi:hypothetical protein
MSCAYSANLAVMFVDKMVSLLTHMDYKTAKLSQFFLKESVNAFIRYSFQKLFH